MNDENSKPTPTGSEPGAAAADAHKTLDAHEITEAEPVYRIQTNVKYNPKLDPSSPEFDKAAWIEANGGRDLHELLSDLSETMRRGGDALSSALAEVYTPGTTAAALQSVKEQLTNISEILTSGLAAFKDFRESDIYRSIIETVQFLIDNQDVIDNYLSEFEQLEPYLKAELKKPKYQGATLEELLSTGTDENGEAIPNSLWSIAINAASLAKSVADALPQLQSTGTPKYYTSPNTALINALQANDGKGELIGAGAVDLPVLSVGKPDEVTVYTIATLENMEGVTITGKPFTEYDRAVHDAVVTLYEDRIKQNQPPVMTADMIYRAMTHKTNTEKVSPQQKGAVTKSIDKMRKNISVYADASAEMQRRRVSINGKPVTEFKIDGFLLSADRITIKAGGETVEAYLLRGEPIMLNYAKLTGQLITVKGTMLDVKEIDSKGNITPVAIPNTVNRISVKSYLLRRVEVMRNDEKRAADALRKYESKRQKDPTLEPGNISQFRKQNHAILFDTLFNSTGITAKTQTAIKDYTYQVLDYWKASGDIKGYRKRKKGKAVDAVIIDL